MKKQSIVRKIAMGIICLSMVVTSLGMSGFTQVVYASEEGDCSVCNATGKIGGEECSTCDGKGHLHDNYSYPYIEIESDWSSHSRKCTKPGCDWSMELMHDMFFSDNPEDIIKVPTCTQDGIEIWRCSYDECTYIEKRIIPAGHIYVYKITSGSAVKYICDLDGHDIERECNDNCIKHSNDEYSCGRITLYASASNTTYSGDDNLASFDRDGIEYWNSSSRVELPTFTYAYKSASEGEYATTTDTKKVGYYKATIEGTALNLEYEVSKATPTLSFSRLSDKYNSVQGAGVTVSPADDSATSKIRVEYKIENKWTTTKPTAVGSYPVRAYMPEGTDNLNAVASESAIESTYVITKADPTAEDVTYTNPGSDSIAYDGTGKSATVVKKEDVEGLGNITVKYQKTTEATMTETAPTEAGTYDVYADIAEGDNYNAGVIKVGAFTIEKANGTLTFSRLSDKSNNIQGAGVVVSPADDSATSKIKVEYKIENEWTSTKPTAVGSYPVRAYMPEGTDNLYAVAVDRASTDTYVIEQYVAPNTPSGGGGGGSTGGGGDTAGGGGDTAGGGATDDGAGDSETGDDKNDTNKTEDTTTETLADGTTVETTTETSDDGTKTETVVESKPDGTKTETVTEEKADGSKSETVTETAKDGSTVETKTETAKNGSKTESIKETSADGKTSSSIEVKTDANGKVKESVVAVDKEVKGKKLTIDMSTITDMIAKNDNATKKNTTVVLTANDKNGKEKFTVDVDAKNLKAGAELKIYAIDKKGNPVIVDASKNNVTVTKTGDIKLNIAGTGDFTIVTPKEAAKMEKAIEKSVKPAKTQVTVEQGMKATFKLDSGCNKDNIAKIIYKSDNANVKVNKNGKITVKDSVNATITATVTLANGKTKTITMKVKGK